ncbi:methyl-accepting chemotaxis protein [Gammaproteobacteria bacterium AS21]
MLNNISIKLKLIFTSIISIAGLTIILGVALAELDKAESAVVRLYDDRIVPLEDLKVIADDYAVSVIDAVNKANAGIFNVEQTLALIHKSNVEIKEKWKKYTQTSLTKEEAILVKDAETLFLSADAAISQTIIELNKFQGNVLGQLDHLDGPLYQTIDPISDKINELISLQLSVAKTERLYISESYHDMLVIFFIIAAAIFLIIITISYLLYQGLMKPITHMEKVIKQISTKSDITLRIQDIGSNELGRIAASFNEMIEQMSSIITLIASTTQKLGDTSAEMTRISGNSNQSSNLQLQSIEQVSIAMNQMVQASQEIAHNASLADQNARQTSSLARDGNTVVSQAVLATNDLVMDVEQVSSKIKTLEQDSENIGTIVDVIKSIAEQTNLLALNAAIEAARAGDQGRGFAVVADEVRTLSQRTQMSTQQIQEAIDRLQQGTNNAVAAMTQGQTKAIDAGEKALQASETLDTIEKSVNVITDINSLIASAIYQQTAVSEDINKSLSEIQQISTESNQDSSKMSTFSGELFNLSKDLQESVKKFRVA